MKFRGFMGCLLSLTMVMTSFTGPVLAGNVGETVEKAEIPAGLAGAAEGIGDVFVIDTVETDFSLTDAENAENVGGMTSVDEFYTDDDGDYSGEVYSGTLRLTFRSVPFEGGITKVVIKEADSGAIMAEGADFKYINDETEKRLDVIISNLAPAEYTLVITADDGKDYLVERAFSSKFYAEEEKKDPKINYADKDADFLETDKYLYLKVYTQNGVDLNRIRPVILNENGLAVTRYAGRIGEVYQLEKLEGYKYTFDYVIDYQVDEGYEVGVPDYKFNFFMDDYKIVYNSKSKKTYLYTSNAVPTGTEFNITFEFEDGGVEKKYEKNVITQGNETLIDWDLTIDTGIDSQFSEECRVRYKVGGREYDKEGGFGVSRMCYETEIEEPETESWFDDCYYYYVKKGEDTILPFVYYYTDGDEEADKYVNDGLTPVYEYYDKVQDSIAFEKLDVVKGVRDSAKKTVTFTVTIPYVSGKEVFDEVKLIDNSAVAEDDDSKAHQHIRYLIPMSQLNQNVCSATYNDNANAVCVLADVLGYDDKDKFTVEFYDADTKESIPAKLLGSDIYESDKEDEIYSDSLKAYSFKAFFDGVYDSRINSAYVRVLYDGKILSDSHDEGRTYYEACGSIADNRYGKFGPFYKPVIQPGVDFSYYAADGNVRGYSGIILHELDRAEVSVLDYKSNEVITRFDVTAPDGKYYFTAEDLKKVMENDEDLTGTYKITAEADGIVYAAVFLANLHVLTDEEKGTAGLEPGQDIEPTATQNADATPTATPNAYATPTATPNADATPTATLNADASPTETQNADASPAATQNAAVPTVTPNADAVPTATPNADAVPTATPNADAVPTATQNADATPTATPNADASPTATSNADATPTATQNAATPTATQNAAVPTATPNADASPAATQNADASPAATQNADAAPTATQNAAVPTAAKTPEKIILTAPSTSKVSVVKGDIVAVSIDGINRSEVQMKGKGGSYNTQTGELTITGKGSIKLFVQDGKKKKIIAVYKCLEPKLKDLKLKTGKSKTIKLKGFSKITWESSDEKIAKVSGGTVTAVSPGTTTIIVFINGHEFKSTVTVK